LYAAWYRHKAAWWYCCSFAAINAPLYYKIWRLLTGLTKKSANGLPIIEQPGAEAVPLLSCWHHCSIVPDLSALLQWQCSGSAAGSFAAIIALAAIEKMHDSDS
jgi:hypothetical protein